MSYSVSWLYGVLLLLVVDGIFGLEVDVVVVLRVWMCGGVGGCGSDFGGLVVVVGAGLVVGYLGVLVLF